MADITFDVSKRAGKNAEGTLNWPAKKLSSPAISGPHNNGALEAGTYKAARAKLLDKDDEDPYTDPSGNAWMQVLDPSFTTTRTELGIHPDGNVAGTSGCIGLKDADTKPWFDAFYAVVGSVTVEVKG